MGWYGVDLDGTLAHYDRWRGPEHVGKPVPAMLERVKRWVTEGVEVRIFTARVAPRADGSHVAAEKVIRTWLAEHGLGGLRVTCVKDFAMVRLYDDRCSPVEPNTGRLLLGEED